MHSRAGGQSAALIKRIARLDVTLQQDQPSFGATELRPRNPIPYGLEPLSSCFQRLEARLRGRRLPQPAAGPANGGGSEVLSVVPPGGSSEVVCSSGCASIGIIAAPLSESLFVKRWPRPEAVVACLDEAN
jgi:hypothetical protein